MSAQLESAGRELLRRASQCGGEERALAVRLELPAAEGAALRLFESAAEEDRFYWEQPSQGRAVCGLGALRRLEAAGASALVQVAAASQSLFDAVEVVGAPAPRAAGPLLLGGFAFDVLAERADASPWRGFAPVSFVLPEAVYVREGPRAWLCVLAWLPAGHSPEQRVALTQRAVERAQGASALLAAPGVDRVLERPAATASEYSARPDRPHATWLESVELALGEIGRGAFEKVVLARSLGVETDVDYDLVSVLAALRSSQPTCTTFAVTRGGSAFVGASPERLLRLEGARLATAALAGSAPRGRNPEEDAAFARGLLESKKEQEEHAFVVREIRAALAPLCEQLDQPEAPRLRALDGIQHLETPVEGVLRGGGDSRPSLLEVAARLHPTPAVCGTPREAAADWLRAHEALERGWYAGGVGVLDADGGGEIAVALRSGVLDGRSARLYAGAGLVAASGPAAELAETRLKLRTLLSQLTEI